MNNDKGEAIQGWGKKVGEIMIYIVWSQFCYKVTNNRF